MLYSFAFSAHQLADNAIHASSYSGSSPHLEAKYAISKGENSVHGSDSDENAKIEAEFHFSGREILF